jgi:uncharacterized membrane protein
MREEKMKSGQTRDSEPSQPVEKAVSLVLRSGVVLSAAIVCLGLALFLAKGSISGNTRIDATMPFPRSLATLLSGLVVLDPASVISLGLVTLIATPFARVAVSIVAFAIGKDWRYVAITALVLGVLIAGLAIGKSLG